MFTFILAVKNFKLSVFISVKIFDSDKVLIKSQALRYCDLTDLYKCKWINK